jgi:hypothetical protein
MKYLSVCSGIEAATVAWHHMGWEPVGFSEIEAFPSAVLSHHYPNVPNFGDMTNFKNWDVARPDVLVGGTPCFSAGAMIATERGFVPIEEVMVGDMVLTHKGRFRKVLKTGSKVADTIIVKGQGHYGIVTTANHPFLARRKNSTTTRESGKSVRNVSISDPQWINAGELNGCHWACVSSWPSLPWSRPDAIGRELMVGVNDETLFTLAGAYLGDGWVRINERRGYVLFGVNYRVALLRVG